MKFLGTSKNGMKVYVDMEKSHAATHFKDCPQLLDVVKRSIPKINIEGEELRIEFDTNEEVGRTDLVETNDTDEIVYALRLHRDRYSRFVKNKTASVTTWIVMSFDRIEEGKYKLYTAFIGRLTPSFPGGDFMPGQSKEFWSRHALVYGNQEIIPGSETKECPW